MLDADALRLPLPEGVGLGEMVTVDVGERELENDIVGVQEGLGDPLSLKLDVGLLL